MIFLYAWIAIAGAASTPLSFEQAVTTILGRSTDIQIQSAALEAARARALPARLNFAPSVEGEGKHANSSEGSGANEQRTATASIRGIATMNLFRFGADISAWKAASADVESSEAALEDVVLSTELAAARSLVIHIQRRKEIRILQELVQIEENSLKIARERYDRGLLPLQEVEKVSIDHSNAQARLAEAELREQESRANLTTLLGHADVEDEWPWKDRLTKEGERLAKDSSSDLDTSAIPSVRAARLREEADDQLLSRSRRLALPSLDAEGTLGRIFPAGQESYPSWTATLVLSVPLFDRLTRLSAAREQAAAHSASTARLEAARRDALSELERAQASLVTAYRTASSREKTAGLTKKLHDDALKRLSLGRLSANELATERARLLDAEQLSVQAWSTAHLALVRFYHSRGKRVF